jgi:hypothetical protein
MPPALAIVGTARTEGADPDCVALLTEDYPGLLTELRGASADVVLRRIAALDLTERKPWATPPPLVRSIASRALGAAPLASLADLNLARRIASCTVTRDDLDTMRDGSAGTYGGGEYGRQWAAQQIRDLSILPMFRAAPDLATEQGRAAVWNEWIRTVHGPSERRVALAVSASLRRWQGRIVARLPNAQPFRAATRESLDAWLVDLLGAGEAAKDLGGDTASAIRQAVALAFRQTARELGLSGSGFDPSTDAATLAIGEMITRVTGTTIEAVSALVQESIAQGVSIGELQERLMAMPEFGRARARTVARTETGRAASIGNTDAMVQAQALGIELDQEWLSARDDAVRPSHAAADGQRVPVGGTFTLGSVSTPGPCQSGVASEDINCRCRTIARRRSKQ